MKVIQSEVLEQKEFPGIPSYIRTANLAYFFHPWLSADLVITLRNESENF